MVQTQVVFYEMINEGITDISKEQSTCQCFLAEGGGGGWEIRQHIDNTINPNPWELENHERGVRK